MLRMNDFLSLGQQIQLLFEARRHPEGRVYTMQEVSDATGISVPAISQMRNSKINNPQLHTLRALCKFFDVPLRYFETRSVEECYAIFQGDNEPPALEVNEIAFRASSLSEAAQRDILNMIKWVQAAEKQRRSSGDATPLPHWEPYDDDE
jgi:transcriptional regulator with XRE-family HTH domain